MILTLEVTGPQAQELGAGARKVFKAIGGAIGRLPDNDWVFPDPYVSGRHALIRYVSGKFFVEDTSTNGVFINSPDNRLARGQPQQLRNGDLLYIDAYRINVSIQNDHTEILAAERQNARGNGAVLQVTTAKMDDTDEEDEDDSDEPEHDRATQWFGVTKLAEPKKPTPAAAPRSRPELVKPTVRVPPPAPAPKASVGEAQFKTLLDAAGIHGLQPDDETARALGEILRIALGGAMETLRTRERMKDDLRMRGTSFKAADNNPLKFSANVDDAFHNMLVKRNPAYLEPADAVEDAFRDVRDHQAAFLAAMRLAFESMLSQFDPQRLQEEFDRQMKGSILGVPAKLRYWDLYRDKYGELIKDAELGFRTLFGDAFGRAYEEHLERLRKTSRPIGQ